MVELEFLLSVSKIDVPSVVDGHDIAMATRLLVLDKIMMTEFGMDKWQTRVRFDVSQNKFRSKVTIP